ncbi:MULTISPECIES: hypothetical protein [unclassified Streptomyces]|uniref:hypothetical protein n=1 Tax=unclassified Streptomyces TaxID=2593676 RepID=UPI00136EA2FF|nr:MULTISPECIES: hypothetical protein [unclassified Streptomyces]MYT18485.1 hypothetical protein [Streptomyces sp. SID4951]
MLVAHAQGVFYTGGGAWALLRPHSFERHFGPQRKKQDQDGLVKTVSALLVSCGWSQIRTCTPLNAWWHAVSASERP